VVVAECPIDRYSYITFQYFTSDYVQTIQFLSYAIFFFTINQQGKNKNKSGEG